MKFLSQRVVLVFAGCLLVLSGLFAAFPHNASAAISSTGGSSFTCPGGTYSLCSNVSITGNFIDQNTIQVTFAGDVEEGIQNGQPEYVNLSFLNLNNGNYGDFYNIDPDTSNLYAFALDGNEYNGYNGACNASGEQPDIFFLNGVNGTPENKMEGASNQILPPNNAQNSVKFDQSSYEMVLQNVYFPDSAIDTSSTGATASGTDTCNAGNNQLKLENQGQTVDNVSVSDAGSPAEISFKVTNSFPSSLGIASSVPAAEVTYILNSDGTIFRSDTDPNYDKTPEAEMFSLITSPSSGNVEPPPGSQFVQYQSNYTFGGAKCSDVLTILGASSGGIAKANITSEASEDNNAECEGVNAAATGGTTVYVMGNFQPGNVTSNYTTPTSNPGNGGGGGAGAATNGPAIDCAVHLFNPLSWFLCPLASGLEQVAGALDSAIDNILTVDTTSSGIQPYQSSWAAVRDISLGLLVIAGLAAIISQATGFEFIDAYTLRKALPRMLIVAIALSLSWPLMIWFIRLTNDLGIDIQSLIYQAAGPDKVHIGAGGQYVIGLIGAVGIASLGFVGLLSFAATAALAASVAFLVLTLRQLIIVMLVIFAPFALVCYVLPHTQRVWKIWWESFSKGLLMFPLITALLALGKVFAAVNSSNNAGSIDQVLAFVGYFAPYFLIPLTFRLAGGAVANIGGFVNDRHRGAFDAVKGFRANRSKTRRHNAKERITSGNAIRGESTFARKTSKALEYASVIPQGGLTLSMNKRRARMANAVHRGQNDEATKTAQENEFLRVFGKDDDKIRAGLEGGNEAGVRNELLKADQKRQQKYEEDRETARRNGEDPDTVAQPVMRFQDPVALEQTVQSIMAAKKSTSREVFNKTAVRALAPTGTAWKHAGEMIDDINKVYGTDRAGAETALAEMRQASLQAGRVDLGGASYGVLQQQLNARYAGNITQDQARKNIRQSVRRANGGGTAVFGKPQSVEEVALAHHENIEEMSNNLIAYQGRQASLQTAIDSGRLSPQELQQATEQRQKLDLQVQQAQDSYDEALAGAVGVYDAMGSAPGENQAIMRRMLMSSTIADPHANPNDPNDAQAKSVLQLAAGRHGRSQVFDESRREYGLRTAEMAQRPGETDEQYRARLLTMQAGQPTAGLPQTPGAGGVPGQTPPS